MARGFLAANRRQLGVTANSRSLPAVINWAETFVQHGNIIIVLVCFGNADDRDPIGKGRQR